MTGLMMMLIFEGIISLSIIGPVLGFITILGAICVIGAKK